MSAQPIIGIDLGTTNSLIACWRDGEARIIPNALGENLTPSAVSLSDDGELIVGRAARDRMVTAPDRSAATFKRNMGSAKLVRLGGREFRPEELSSLVLGQLKRDAEAHLGVPVTEAVITVPAYFNDTQRRATRAAGELAGLRVERLLNEPTAAALAYGLHADADQRRVLVFDLGGGTFDVSVLELFEGVIEIHASAGDNFLGGEDFNAVLVEAFLKACGVKSAKLSATDRGVLWAQAERAKRALSAGGSAEMTLTHRGETLRWSPEVAEFDRLCEPLLARVVRPIERALRDARLRLDQLDDVVLVGGATRMTAVPRLVARMLGRLPLRHLNPDEVVALGAAVQAALKTRDAALHETVLTDVCPYTLGIETRSLDRGRISEGMFAPIIERNTTIPVSRSQPFSPLHDHQTQIELRIYQGESHLIRDNILLGELTVPLPRGKASEVTVDVRFTYDINGVLQVEATTPDGLSHELIVEQNAGTLSREEIAQRFKELARLKVHPRDAAENLALLERANRVYAESIGDARAAVGQMIERFLALLDRQDERDIAEARDAIAAQLDAIEGEFRI